MFFIYIIHIYLFPLHHKMKLKTSPYFLLTSEMLTHYVV